MNKKVLLTGINGFLGSHVALQLIKNGYYVIGLSRTNKLPLILKQTNVEICQGDLLMPDSYKRKLNEFFAWKIYSEEEINHFGTKILLEKSEEAGIKRFIHTSTRGTLGVSELPENSNEDVGYKSMEYCDEYIRSKYLAEIEVKKYSKIGKMACIILSPTALIGSFDYKPSPIGQIILSVLKKKTKYYMDGGINIIDVEDAAKVYIEAMTKGKNGSVYILGNQNILLYKFFDKLSNIAKIPGPEIKIPFWAAYWGSVVLSGVFKISGTNPFVSPQKVMSLYKKWSFCNGERARQEFGIEYSDVNKTLEKTVSWFKESGYI